MGVMMTLKERKPGGLLVATIKNMCAVVVSLM